MNTLTARAYQVRQLPDDRLKKLQQIERDRERYLTPCEIQDMGDLPENGDIPERSWRKVENPILSIFNVQQLKLQNENPVFVLIAKPGEKDGLYLIHLVDWLIRKQNIDFTQDDHPQVKRRRDVKDYTQSKFENI